MTLTESAADFLRLRQNLITINLTYWAIKVESNDRDPCSEIVSKLSTGLHVFPAKAGIC